MGGSRENVSSQPCKVGETFFESGFGFDLLGFRGVGELDLVVVKRHFLG